MTYPPTAASYEPNGSPWTQDIWFCLHARAKLADSGEPQTKQFREGLEFLVENKARKAISSRMDI